MTTETRFVVYGLRNRIIQKADINPVSAVHVNTLPLYKQDVIWSYSKSVHFSPFLLSSSMLILVSSHCRSVHRLQHTEHGAGVAWRWTCGGVRYQWRLHQHWQTFLERGTIYIYVLLFVKTLSYCGVHYMMCNTAVLFPHCKVLIRAEDFHTSQVIDVLYMCASACGADVSVC